MALYETLTQYSPILISIQTEATTDENLREYLDEQSELWRELVARGQKVVFVCDCTLGTSLSATQRGMYADWLNLTRAQLDASLVGVAFVIDSALVRGALTAIFWLARLSAPHVVHRSLDDALRWALVVAREQQLELPRWLEIAGDQAFASLVERRRLKAAGTDS